MRFLSDYFERAGLRGVPANQLGMIEQVVISHGRTFTGTFYSSFSAHVFRHRLYLGKVGWPCPSVLPKGARRWKLRGSNRWVPLRPGPDRLEAGKRLGKESRTFEPLAR